VSRKGRDPARRRADLEVLLTPVIAPVEPGEHTSLLRSGLIDSMGLFHLILWVEAQLGHPIDPTTLDVRAELDTVAGILAYLDREAMSDGK
jgi:acyl carrier protein